MKVKNDHRSEFSNLSNWKEEAWKKKKIRALTCHFYRLHCDILPVSCCFTNSSQKTFSFFKRQILNSPQVKESRKVLLVASEILGFRIQNTAQEIWNRTNDWNPESKFPLTKTVIQYLETGIHDCPRFSWMERVEFTCQFCYCKRIDPDPLGNIMRLRWLTWHARVVTCYWWRMSWRLSYLAYHVNLGDVIAVQF